MYSAYQRACRHQKYRRLCISAIPVRADASKRNRSSSGSLVLLLLKNVWRTGNVLLSRNLKIQPRYCPVMLFFLTGRCNLRCRMCGVCDLKQGYDNEEELSTSEWKALISDAARNLGTTLAVISGGEALLRDDVFEIIHHAESSGISIHLCTNALLLSEEKMARLIESGVSTVSFSVDGPVADIHEHMRGSNTFGKLTDTIRRFRELAPQVNIGINFVITRHNFRYMTDMLRFAESLGANQIKFAPIHTNLLHKDKDFSDCKDLVFTEEDLPSLELEVQKARKACLESGLITTSGAFFDGITRLYREPNHIKCYAGYAICAVSPSGYVAPCSNMDSGFNVREHSISDIWRDPDFQRLRNKVHTCSSACWDTAYTELSLWLRPVPMVLNVARNLRDIFFYFGIRKK